jgi:hypothetical protein
MEHRMCNPKWMSQRWKEKGGRKVRMKTHSSVICLSGHECAGIFGAYCLLGLPFRVETLWSPRKTGQSLVSVIPILRSCGIHYRNISGICLKQPPGLHHAKPPCVSIWNIYFILMDVILISMYQCWAVLTFLWELAGFGSHIMLWEPDQFFNILFFTSENWPKLSRFLSFPHSPDSQIGWFLHI